MIFKLAETQQEKEEIYRLRYRVYCLEKDWLSKADYPDEKEIDEFDDCSAHFIAKDSLGNITGTVRLILHSQQGFQITRYFEIDLPNGGLNCSEFSRLAINNGKRNNKIELGLYRETFQYCQNKGITHSYAVVERKLFSSLRRLGFLFEQIGEPRYYFGDYTIPICLFYSEGIEFLKANKPLMLKFLKEEAKVSV